jgi:hypothetical protein
MSSSPTTATTRSLTQWPRGAEVDDSSILSLTTSCGLVPKALTSTNLAWALWCLQPSSDHQCPSVTVVSRSLSHADRTSCLGAWPSRPERAGACSSSRRTDHNAKPGSSS